MDIKDRLNAFFTSDPQSFPTATSAPTEIISGRVSVHSVIGTCLMLARMDIVRWLTDLKFQKYRLS